MIYSNDSIMEKEKRQKKNIFGLINHGIAHPMHTK
jgi:hypothetical protein